MPPDQKELEHRYAGRILTPNPTSGSVSRFASARTADPERLSFEAVVASDTPAVMWDWDFGRYVHEILVASGAEMPDRTPLLNCHRRQGTEDVIGAVSDFRLEGSSWLGRAELTKGVGLAEDAFRKVAAGHLTDLSIGYHRLETQRIAANSEAIIGSYRYHADPDYPLLVTTRWTIYEVSLVPIGADPTAKVRGGADPYGKLSLKNPPEYVGGRRLYV